MEYKKEIIFIGVFSLMVFSGSNCIRADLNWLIMICIVLLLIIRKV